MAYLPRALEERTGKSEAEIKDALDGWLTARDISLDKPWRGTRPRTWAWYLEVTEHGGFGPGLNRFVDFVWALFNPEEEVQESQEGEQQPEPMEVSSDDEIQWN